MAGLDKVIVADTMLSSIDGEKGRLIIRGKRIEELANACRFEEAVYFLLSGCFPTDEEKKWINQQLILEMNLDKEFQDFLFTIPLHLDAISYLMSAFSALDRKRFSWPATIEQAFYLMGKIPAILEIRQRRLDHRPLVLSDEQLSYAGNYLYKVLGEKPNEDAVQAIDCYFKLTMEHGLNASSFTSRVITSTESDLVSAVVGAMAALKGPLHGGAPSEVIKMFEEIGTVENIVPWLTKQLNENKKIMGFGHRVYRTRDPRANVLKEIAKKLASENDWLNLALEMEEEAEDLLQKYKPHRPLKTNVEFYAAAVFKAIGLPEDMYTATFATSRLAGWTAHAIEQASNNRIIRPSSRYIGPKAD